MRRTASPTARTASPTARPASPTARSASPAARSASPAARPALPFLLVLAALLAFLASPAAIAAQAADPPDGDEPGWLQVTGTAEVNVPSDRAEVSLAVETEGSTAREAAAENASRMERVISSIRQTGVAGLEVETRGYSLRPRYVRPERNEAPRIEGYTAVNHVVATVEDPSAVGRLIDAGVGAGANRIASLRFYVEETGPARSEALRRATEKARTEAEVVAGAMGMRLGLPLEVNIGYDSPSPRMMEIAAVRMESADMAPPTPVEPGEQAVQAQVTIRWTLLPR